MGFRPAVRGRSTMSLSNTHRLALLPIPRPLVDPDPAPADVPWCVACGFQHDSDTHCAECAGVHQAGYCLTPAAIAELAKRDQLSTRIEAAAPQVIDSRDYPTG